MATSKRRLTAALFLGSTLAASPALAEKDQWQLDPFIELRESYSDNVTAASTGREGDAVTTVKAGLNVRRDGANFDLDAEYEGTFLVRADGENDFRNRFLGGLNFHPSETGFRAGVSALVEERFVGRNGQIGFNPEHSFSSDINTVRTLRGYANWQGEAGPFLLKGGYVGSVIKTDLDRSGTATESRFQDGSNHNFDASVGNRYGRLRVNGFVRYQLIDQERAAFAAGSRSYDSLQAGTNLRFKVKNGLDVTASVAYARSKRNTIIGRDGVYWDAGFDYSPNGRTSIVASYGMDRNDHRVSLNLSHRFTRRFNIFAQFNETIASDQVLGTSLLDGISRDDFGQYVNSNGDLLSDPSTYYGLENRLYRQKAASSGFTYIMKRTTFSLSGNWSEREFGTRNISGTEQYGVRATVVHRMTPKSNISANLSWFKVHYGDLSARNDYITGSLTYFVRFGPHFTGRVTASHSQREFNRGVEMYKDNSVSVALRAQF